MIDKKARHANKCAIEDCPTLVRAPRPREKITGAPENARTRREGRSDSRRTCRARQHGESCLRRASATLRRQQQQRVSSSPIWTLILSDEFRFGETIPLDYARKEGTVWSGSVASGRRAGSPWAPLSVWSSCVYVQGDLLGWRAGSVRTTVLLPRAFE